MDYAALSNNLSVSDQHGRKRNLFHCNLHLNAGVAHALLEQLTLFPNASIVLEDAGTPRSTLRPRIKALTKCRQSHVNAGTVLKTQERKVDLWPASVPIHGLYLQCVA